VKPTVTKRAANWCCPVCPNCLFVEALRLYINRLPAEQTGWLAGTRDAVVGEALALLHREVTHPRRVAALARRLGSSRTRLAERFRHYLGEPPTKYLTKWRLRLGAEMLRSSEKSVAETASAVGYGSEAAFNRAFKNTAAHRLNSAGSSGATGLTLRSNR